MLVFCVNAPPVEESVSSRAAPLLATYSVALRYPSVKGHALRLVQVGVQGRLRGVAESNLSRTAQPGKEQVELRFGLVGGGSKVDFNHSLAHPRQGWVEGNFKGANEACGFRVPDEQLVPLVLLLKSEACLPDGVKLKVMDPATTYV